jgi:alkylation response protein AidB-like acyl-CoA dehydrogenase
MNGMHPDTPPASGLIDRVSELAPMIAANAEQAEIQRKPVDAVIEALKAAGVFHAYVPARFGGYEIDTDTFIDVGLIISEACTSTGWVTTFYMEHNWMLAQFPDSTQTAIFTEQPYILAPGSISPTGKAEKVDGGYRLDGRWQWGTGIMHADWALLNGIVMDGPAPDPRLFIVRREEIEVEDTWFAAGMEGTGSNDMIAKDLFVPAEYSESLLAMMMGRGSGTQANDSPCYRHPMLPLLCIAAATPAVGAARRAIELFTERLGGRTLYGAASKQAEHQSAQILLGNSQVQVQSAETLLRDVGHRLTRWGDTEEFCPPQERVQLRLQAAQVVQSCRTIVQNLMSASGASAHMRTHPMQRISRDCNTLSCHTVFDTDIAAENLGRIMLGMDPATPV